jgi:ABC-type nitrate/sulfonate/bicarbonate transport system permease component
LAVPASIIGATMGEWLGTRNGIGHLITVSLYQLNPGVLYASLAAIMFSSIISIFALSVIGKIVTPWVIKN